MNEKFRVDRDAHPTEKFRIEASVDVEDDAISIKAFHFIDRPHQQGFRQIPIDLSLEEARDLQDFLGRAIEFLESANGS